MLNLGVKVADTPCMRGNPKARSTKAAGTRFTGRFKLLSGLFTVGVAAVLLGSMVIAPFAAATLARGTLAASASAKVGSTRSTAAFLAASDIHLGARAPGGTNATVVVQGATVVGRKTASGNASRRLSIRKKPTPIMIHRRPPPTTTTTSVPPTTTTTTSVPPSESRAASVLGDYAGPASASLITTNAVVGHQVRYAMDFLDGTSWATISDPSWLLSQWQGKGYQMIWGVPILPNSGASLDVGATGAYNQYFEALSAALVAGGQGSSVIRLGWEFNGGWFPWAANGHAASFVAYWRQIVDSMRSIPGANFKFEWNPTRGDLGVGDLASYYPGDAYVDIVGLDVYDVEWASYPGAVAEWQKMLTQSYGLNWLASFGAAHGKPLAIPEWGLGWTDLPVGSGGVGGGDNAYFVQQMANWVNSNNVVNVIAWQYGSDPLPDASQFPNATAAFGQDF